MQLLKVTGHGANGTHIGLADGRFHLVYLFLLQFIKQRYHFPGRSS